MNCTQPLIFKVPNTLDRRPVAQFPLQNFYVQRDKPIIYAPLRSKTVELSSAGSERNIGLIFFCFALQMVI